MRLMPVGDEPASRVSRKGDHPIFKRGLWMHAVRNRTLHAVRPFPFAHKLYCGTEIVGYVDIDPRTDPDMDFYICRECLDRLGRLGV